jgi:hypothetical protein
MAAKTEQLQIRISAEQKRALKRRAKEAGVDISSWVLGQVLPAEADRFQALAARVADPTGRRYALAELEDWLRGLPAGAFGRAVEWAPRAALDGVWLNYVAGAIELAAAARGVPAPRWVSEVAIPGAPLFGSGLAAVRLHLLSRGPVALRRRNVFVDASIDQRV